MLALAGRWNGGQSGAEAPLMDRKVFRRHMSMRMRRIRIGELNALLMTFRYCVQPIWGLNRTRNSIDEKVAKWIASCLSQSCPNAAGAASASMPSQSRPGSASAFLRGAGPVPRRIRVRLHHRIRKGMCSERQREIVNSKTAKTFHISKSIRPTNARQQTWIRSRTSFTLRNQRCGLTVPLSDKAA